MKVTVCDRCGEIIPHRKNITKVCVSVWYNPESGGSVDIVSGDTQDFCPECLSDFIKIMTGDYPFHTTGHEDDER